MAVRTSSVSASPARISSVGDPARPAYDWVEGYESTRGDKTTWLYPPGAAQLGHLVDDSADPGYQFAAGENGIYRLTAKARPVRVNNTLTRAMTFTDLFYGRLHLNPSLIELGNLLTAQVRETELWNASFAPVTITAIQTVGTDGVDMGLPRPVPITLAPLEAITIQLSISTSGPTVLDASYLFDADVLKDALLRVTGTRSVVFALAPDTSKSYLEKLEWISDVITAHDGTEQRMAVSEWPDTQISMSLANHQHPIHMLDSLLWGWQHRVYTLPLWHRGTKLTAPAFIDLLEIPCDTTYVGFRVGGIGILWNAYNSYETFEVVEVLADRVVARRPLQRTWTGGTLVAACRQARLPTEVSVSWDHADLASTSVNFVFTEVEVEDPYEFTTLYRDQPVLLEAPNWVGGLSETSTRAMEAFETDLRSRYTLIRSEVPTIVKEHAWFLKGKEKIHRFRRWLFNRKGRTVPFWAPSWKADFTLVSRVEQGNFTITVKDINYRGLYRYNTGRQDIIIILRDGTRFMRRIISAAEGSLLPGTEVLVLDAEIGRVIEVKQVAMICFLGLYRLDADAVELDWRSDQLVLCSQNMRLLTDGV